MSNLGGYQLLTTLAKKLGGPKNLVLLLMVGGAVIGTTTVEGGKFAVKKAKKFIDLHNQKKAKNITGSTESNTLYTISKCRKSNEGLVFAIGDQFRVLEFDGDAILIELIGNDNNPHFVAAELLREISDYK
ncbi:MAG: hypothetical protein PHZ09_06875 [Eubacteriales bacterium]|nr:hypothetical protein [Eubacteriales bacterium]